MNENQFYSYRISPENRRMCILLALLTSSQTINILDLQDVFCVSRGTIISDINYIKQDKDFPDLEFDSNKHFGYKVLIRSTTRIVYIYRTLKSLCNSVYDILHLDKNNVICNYIYGCLKLEVFKQGAEIAVSLAEQHFKITMSDEYFYDAVMYTCIMTYVHACEDFNIEQNIEKTIEDNNDSNLTSLAEYILKLALADNKINEQYITLLANKFKDYSLFSYADTEIDNPINFHIITKSFLYKLSLVYKINFIADEKLSGFLTAHITSMYRRIVGNEVWENPYKKQMISDYHSDYRIMKNNAYVLEDNLHIKINEDELTYILMHIVAALERMKQNSKPPSVIVVCNSGFSTSVFLSETIKKHFPLNVVNVTSSHNLNKCLDEELEKNNGVDFIISTIPLKNINYPWIQVHAILSQEDINNIHKNINRTQDNTRICLEDTYENSDKTLISTFEEVKKVKGQENELNFYELLNEDNIRLDKTATNWKEAIISAGEPLLWSGKVTAEYISAMVNNVVDNGPYIVIAPGIAVAHANTADGAVESGVSYLKLKEPVEFGSEENDPVSIILAISIDYEKKYFKLFLKMMTIICIEKAREQLLHADTVDKVKKIFAYYERIM